LDKYIPYIKHFHGKFWEITEEGIEYSIPYDEFILYLKEKNFDGYNASEYEGGRFALPGTEIDAVTQVRVHQKMLRTKCYSRRCKSIYGLYRTVSGNC
jgi:hypothetical protein